MSIAKRTVLLALAAAACLAAAAIAGLLALRTESPPGVPPEMVPAAWAEYRTSLGHTQHVGKETIHCKDCHDYEREGFKSPGAAPCARCHAKEAARSHLGAEAKKTDCLTCHVFAPNVQAPPCIRCHVEPERHLPAIKTHATTVCTSCHLMHDDPAQGAQGHSSPPGESGSAAVISVVPKDCASCHEEVAQSHANHVGSKGCSDCHAPHAPAVAALNGCRRCHENKSAALVSPTPHTGKPEGHESCIDCHRPHGFTASASECVTCHQEKPTLRATTVQAHAVCTTCHEPHAPAAAASSCARCHSGIQVAHGGTSGTPPQQRPDLGAEKACIACHAPHTGDVNGIASACTSCHWKVGASDVSAHAGNTACVNCHKPHDFTPPSNKLALCATCHGSESARVASNPGHADCTTCHGADAHRPAKAPACATCHAKEQASAPKGHQDCLFCHEPHGGARIPKVAVCTNCHADKTGGPHGGEAFAKGAPRSRPGAEAGCETCHRPHGPAGTAAPPACRTCHAPAKLPALHSVPAHDACASCHTSHALPRSDRATCTATCHADRRDHQPQAQACGGCHVFRK